MYMSPRVSIMSCTLRLISTDLCTNSTSGSVMNRCAVTSTSAVLPFVLNTTPVLSSVTTNTTSTHSHSSLKFYAVACIAIGGSLFIFLCAVCGIGIFKVWSKRQPQHTISGQRQSDNAIELRQVNNLQTSCDMGGQASYQSNQDEEISSLQVQIGDESSVFESADDVTLRDPSPSDNQIRESHNLETLSGFEGPEHAVSLEEVQPASTLELSQSQEQLQSQVYAVPPAGEIRDTPGSLLIVRSISETHQDSVHMPNGRSQSGRQMRLDSMLSPLSDITNSSVHSRSGPSRSTETSFLQSIDDYTVDSNELMFLGPVRVLVCDSRGGRFPIPEHGITLTFPQGAVQGTIEVEVGVAIHGLFDFPDDLQPISVLVWVQAKRPNFEFQKRIEISLPHYLKLSKDDVRDSSDLGLGFMVTDGEENGNQRHHLIFKEGAKDQVSYKQTRAIISTTHFCYMCLSAKMSVITEKSCYLLSQVQPEPITSLRWQIQFFVSYNLCSFIEVSSHHSSVANITHSFHTVQMIKQYYHSQGNVVSQKPFQFISPAAGKKPELEIRFQTPIKGWQVTLPTYKTVT